jgi:ribosomal protein S18 acetylase RimI-like enzyme
LPYSQNSSPKIVSPSEPKQSPNVIPLPVRVVLNAVLIERVATKKRALDVNIFRGFTISPAEYIKREIGKQKAAAAAAAAAAGTCKDDETKIIVISEDEAIDHLMRGYDDRGDYINPSSLNAPAVQFAALYRSQEEVGGDDDADVLIQSYAKQNSVMGVVSAQIRSRDSPITMQDIETGSCSSISPTAGMTMKQLPPHVYLANMRVDGRMQRRGVGTALLSAVTSYAETQEDISVILLDVYNDNLGAIRMYERHGYRYMYQNDEFGTMFQMV